ncbi:hypothetical protein MMC28_009562 [Mycoblastus sanguinarius]|nr:hypothetical protein [Mycoblastus sanguinarius]
MAGGTWKTLLFPPLFALLLYLLTSYILIPYYRRFRAHSSYTLLPSSASPSHLAPNLFSRVSTLLGRPRRNSDTSEDSLLGDEELEEGLSESVLQDGRSGTGGVADMEDGERRLSRELERGFRDSSDEEEEPRGQRRR